MRNRVVTSLAAAAALMLGLTACAGSSLGGTEEPTEDGPLKLGFIVPKTGVYATLGAELERAVEVFLDQHDNQLGGRDVELVAIDEGGTAETATAAAQRLIQNEEVDVATGVINTAAAFAVAPMFADAGIPMLSTASVEGNDYWWRIGWTNPAINQSMVDYLFEIHKDDPLYLIAADYKQGHDIMEAVKAGFEAGGGTVVDTAFTPFGTTQDFQPYLAKIIDSGAAATYAFYAGGEAINFVKQYDQFGLGTDIPLYANQGLTEGVIGAQGESAEGVITNGTYSDTLDNELNKEFVDAYSAAYDAKPNVYTEAQYAALIVIDEALKAKNGGTIQEAIEGLGEVTTPRGVWHFDEGRAPTQVIYLRLATDQDGVMVNKIIEEIGVYSSDGELQ